MSVGAPATKTDVETVPELLIRAAWAAPEVDALRTPGASIGYGELLERSRVAARELDELGCAPGTAVAVQWPNGPEWLVAYWGCALHRNVVVPISPFAPEAETERLLARSRAVALFSERGLVRLDGGSVEPAPGLAAVHVVQLTSGSTGEPKGAMLTHRGLLAAARHQAEAWGLGEGEALFVPNPFCHVLGLVHGVLVPAAARATVLTLARFELDAALDLVVEGRAVGMTGAPTHFQMLAEHAEDRGLELSDLRLGYTGGAPMPPQWVERTCRALGLRALINGYGMSEVGSVAHTREDDSPEQVFGSVGFLVPGLEGRIVDPKTRLDRPDGEVGELWIRGPTVMAGYFDDPDLTREVLVDADAGGPWLRTGDLMRRDADGRLSFVGRLDDRIVVGGFNVHPAEVERVLLSHPDIAQAVVVGRSHDRLGSVPVAFVRRRRSDDGEDEGRLDVAEVIDHCRAQLSGYRVPRRIEVLEDLPSNRAGKPDRRRLAALAEDLDVD